MKNVLCKLDVSMHQWDRLCMGRPLVFSLGEKMPYMHTVMHGHLFIVYIPHPSPSMYRFTLSNQSVQMNVLQ